MQMEGQKEKSAGVQDLEEVQIVQKVQECRI
jgi:hypothetical protein